MQPELILNFAAMGLSVIAAFFVGYVWYGPLFGKLWAREMGHPADFAPEPREMMRGLALQILGLVLMTYVLAHTSQIWRPSVWNAGADQADWVYAAYSTFFTWIGFFIPVLLSNVAWEGKSWRLFALNAAYYAVILGLINTILSHWR
ncbi:MAG: DUF1761 domain-containing protein [bacterium]|nr:DUF1761 domain-containing protein [bacterium]